MCKVLPLVDTLFTRSQVYYQTGNKRDAEALLTRLCRLPIADKRKAAQCHELLGEILFDREDYAAARRHFSLAIVQDHDNAQLYYRMALAIDSDDDANPTRAGRYFRKALELDAKKTDYHVDFAIWCLNQDKTKSALRSLRAAFDLAPHDADLLAVITDVLRQSGLTDEIERMLRIARFLNKGDLRFRRLWEQHRFHTLAKGQKANRKSVATDEAKPTILPFPKRTEPAAETGYRWDGPAILTGPHFPVIHKFTPKGRRG